MELTLFFVFRKPHCIESNFDEKKRYKKIVNRNFHERLRVKSVFYDFEIRVWKSTANNIEINGIRETTTV